MQKLFLVFGVIFIIACILALFFAVLNMLAYYGMNDGSQMQYEGLHQRMITFFVVGIVLAVLGTVCMVFYFK